MCRAWLTVRRVTLGFCNATGPDCVALPPACNAGLFNATPAGLYALPPALRQKKLASIRPFVRTANETGANRIVQHVLAFCLGTFETANPVVKRSALP